jgi:two-component system LytT family sensor kinase
VPYVQALADSYRYLLETRRLRKVSLAQELALLDRFATLAEIRMPGALRLEVDVPHDRAAELYLPPVTLPELLDNAVKHNEASPEHPLVVTVRLEGDRLVVSNPLRPRPPRQPSSSLGLANLAERVRLTTRAPMVWEASAGRFAVSLALLSRDQAASNGQDTC